MRVTEDFIKSHQEMNGSSLIVCDGHDFSDPLEETVESNFLLDAMMERRKNVTDVVFLLNITTIGKWACFECIFLVSAAIPEGIESIEFGAFFSCIRLSNVTFPNSLKSIGESAFHGCIAINEIDLSHTMVDKIPDECFNGCKNLKTLKLPQSFKYAGYGAFGNCEKLVPAGVDTYVRRAMLPYLIAAKTYSPLQKKSL
jgi:hypothetical protein